MTAGIPPNKKRHDLVPPSIHAPAMSPTALRVRGMSWTSFQRLSNVLRKINHDMNNAMVPLLGHMDLLQLRHPQPGLAEEITTLANDMLEIRGMITRATENTLRQRHLRPPTLPSISNQFERAARPLAVTLRWHNSSPAEEHLPGLTNHETALLLTALFQNALQAHLSDGPDLEHAPSDKQIWITISQTAEQTLVEVSDNGPGCPDLKRASEGETDKRGLGHLGLGLQVAATLAEKAQGTLHIDASSAGGFVARVLLNGDT